MEAFGRSDHAEVLSCLTDDVEWLMPGYFTLSGKNAFDREIENDAFVGQDQGSGDARGAAVPALHFFERDELHLDRKRRPRNDPAHAASLEEFL